MYIFKKRIDIVYTGERQGKLFKLKFKVITLNIEEPQVNIVIKDILRLWYERLIMIVIKIYSMLIIYY